VIYNIPTRDRSEDIPNVSLNTAATERDDHSRVPSFVHNKVGVKEEEDMGTVRQIVYPPRVESNPKSRDSTPKATIREQSSVNRHSDILPRGHSRNPSREVYGHARNPSAEVYGHSRNISADISRKDEGLLSDMLRPLDICGIGGGKRALEREMRERLRAGRGILEELIESM
jgi:hypothetical protein